MSKCFLKFCQNGDILPYLDTLLNASLVQLKAILFKAK